MKRTILIIAFSFCALAPVSADLSETNSSSGKWIDGQVSTILKQAETLDETVLRMALGNYKSAIEASLTSSSLLTVVDYAKPSGMERLWVIDLAESKVLFHELVAHGRNSGDHKTATRFSNRSGSLQSSLGLFLTGVKYVGKDFGPSLKLHGLSQGINDNALARGIVMHGAAYVSEQRARERGNVGRSFGCLSVRREIARPLIDKIKNGSVLYVYHPQILA